MLDKKSIMSRKAIVIAFLLCCCCASAAFSAPVQKSTAGNSKTGASPSPIDARVGQLPPAKQGNMYQQMRIQREEERQSRLRTRYRPKTNLSEDAVTGGKKSGKADTRSGDKSQSSEDDAAGSRQTPAKPPQVQAWPGGLTTPPSNGPSLPGTQKKETPHPMTLKELHDSQSQQAGAPR